MNEAVHQEAYALLIGVDDYTAFAPNGESNLPGSVNDVAVWYEVLLRRRFRPNNIRVLASPTGALPPALAGSPPATMENIRKALGWLAARTANPRQSVGFLAFSGHGDVDATGAPAICPTDTRWPDADTLENVIPIAKILEPLQRNSTIVLDCCHSSDWARAPNQWKKASSKDDATIPIGAMRLSLRGKPASAITEDPYKEQPEPRVVSATWLSGVAFQAELCGRYQGALTWALTSALGQWEWSEAGLPRVTLPCFTARERAEKLIGPLTLPQVPALHGKHVQEENDARATPLIGIGVPISLELVSHVPDAKRIAIQFPPCLKVWLQIAGVPEHDSGVISAVNYDPPAGYNRNQEYWRLSQAFLDAVRDHATPLSFVPDLTTAPPDWEDIIAAPPHPLFTMELVPDWEDSAAPTEAGYYLINGDQSAAVMFDLVPPIAGAPWNGSITWYRALPPAGDERSPVFGAGGATFAFREAAPAGLEGYNWQKAKLSPS